MLCSCCWCKRLWPRVAVLKLVLLVLLLLLLLPMLLLLLCAHEKKETTCRSMSHTIVDLGTLSTSLHGVPGVMCL